MGDGQFAEAVLHSSCSSSL
uniref:Uncharacterized protein n=1 Tax=Arundo donax TaxID=35708 RepID=A0A0A9CGC9_ARUDO